MMSRRLAHIAAAAFILCGSLFAATIAVAQQPTPRRPPPLSQVREILDSKASFTMFEPLVPGVIETAKNVLLQQRPNLQKDLNEAAADASHPACAAHQRTQGRDRQALCGALHGSRAERSR